MNELDVYNALTHCNSQTINNCNEYLRNVMQTRGGRVGSGMGSVLETLWGYNMNSTLRTNGYSNVEVAWFPDHQYNDFAIVRRDSTWNPNNGSGEYFRLEAKSMQVGENVDEPKAHFNVLQSELGLNDAILLIIWKWTSLDGVRVYPEIVGVFLNKALFLAQLRDELHLLRGGSFIGVGECPDCIDQHCRHTGEPLNASGKRERISGPESLRVSSSTSYAANFGGMLRMLKASSMHQKQMTRQIVNSNPVYRQYVNFIHTHFPNEEKCYYNIAEWRQVLIQLGIDASTYNLYSVDQIYHFIRNNYQRSAYINYLPNIV